MRARVCFYTCRLNHRAVGHQMCFVFFCVCLCVCMCVFVCVCVCGGGLPEGTCGISSCTGGYAGWPAARSHLCPPGQSAASRGCHYRSRSGCRPAPLRLSSHSEKKTEGLLLLVSVDGWLKGRRKNRGDKRNRGFDKRVWKYLQVCMFIAGV